MAGNHLKAILDCGCGCGCIGCCLPTVADPGPYAFVMASIPWELVAPSCPSIDGINGEFTPIDATNPGIGPCGFCMTYCDFASPGTISLPGTFVLDMGFFCLTSPCGFGALKLILECNNDTASDCCGRLILWVGITLSTGSSIVGFSTESPPAACGSNDGYQWKKIPAAVCSCEGGLSAEFPLELSIECDEYWTSGPCAGQPKCCQINCVLTGAKIVI